MNAVAEIKDVGLYMRQLGEQVMHSRIAEAFTEFEWDGRRGYGMTEYVERLDDGVPVAWPL